MVKIVGIQYTVFGGGTFYDLFTVGKVHNKYHHYRANSANACCMPISSSSSLISNCLGDELSLFEYEIEDADTVLCL